MFRVQAWAFDDIMTFEYLKSLNLIISTFFLASQVLSFRHKKQTNKNVADTTFNLE